MDGISAAVTMAVVLWLLGVTATFIAASRDRRRRRAEHAAFRASWQAENLVGYDFGIEGHETGLLGGWHRVGERGEPAFQGGWRNA